MTGACTEVVFDDDQQPILDVSYCVVRIPTKRPVTVDVITMVRDSLGSVVVKDKKAQTIRTRYPLTYVCLSPRGYKMLKVKRPGEIQPPTGEGKTGGGSKKKKR